MAKIKKLLPFIGLFWAFMPQQLFAMNELQREFRSARQLGQGDVGLSTALGGDAIFYNPAGIADNKKILSEIIFLSPQVTASTNIMNVVKAAKNNSDALTFIAENQNQVFYGDVQNFSGIIFRKTALGVLAKANATGGVFTDPTTGLPEVQAYASSRLGVYMSFAKDFFNQTLLLGTTLKYINKTEANISLTAVQAEEELAAHDLTSLIKSNLHRGNGVGADLGLLFAPKSKKNFKLGVVYRNIGMVYRASPEGSKAPSREPQVLDMGLSVAPGTGKSVAKFSLDVRDVTNVQGVSIYERVHLGTEINFLGIIGVLAGLNQGYPTYGGFLDFRIVRIEGGVYAEELGSYPGQIRSQRAFGRISVGWLL